MALTLFCNHVHAQIYVANFSGLGEYGLDGSIINANLISGLVSPWGIVVVPEPSTLALGLLGVAGCFLSRRRK